MLAIRTEHTNSITGEIVHVVAMNEIKPNDPMIRMINKNKSHRVMPLVEYIDSLGNWHITALEDFTNLYKEI